MVSLGDNLEMRADIPLYVIAAICFISAIGLHFYSTWVSGEASAYTVILAVLGAIFAGVGYSMKPKMAEAETIETIETPATIEESPAATIEEKPSLELVDVKGIGPKRAEQLKSVGIQTVEELASQSSEELSQKMKVSAKVADKWIKAAKEVLEEKQ